MTDWIEQPSSLARQKNKLTKFAGSARFSRRGWWTTFLPGHAQHCPNAQFSEFYRAASITKIFCCRLVQQAQP